VIARPSGKLLGYLGQKPESLLSLLPSLQFRHDDTGCASRPLDLYATGSSDTNRARMRSVGSFWRSFAATLAVLLGSPHALATYSIAGADTSTGEVGGAGTSCLSGSDVYMIYGSVPGVGVVHTQSFYSLAVHARSVELVRQGLSPAQVIAALTDDELDPEAYTRQFAVVDIAGVTATFTGSGARPYAGDRSGRTGTFAYSAQGNLLTSAAVLEQAASAFEAPACDLAERLLRALEAGANYGEGDGRCTVARGIPSDSAFVQVDRPGEPAGSYLAVRVPASGNDDPLPILRAAFDEWRLAHPCPSAGSAGTTSVPPPAAGTVPERSGASCRFSASSAGGSPLAALALSALLLLRLRRWNRRRFQC
jgi:uncharacterized Ntn-hydrolase superfamily protein